MAESEIHPLTREEAQLFLDVCSGQRFEALYVVAISTGMRQSELLGLHWRDIDLDDGVLRVRAQLKREDGRWLFKEPKTKKSRRQIALAAPTVAALRRHRACQDDERRAVGELWQDLDLVFCTHGGGPLMARNLYRDFKTQTKRAELPTTVRFHDLRHTCATLLLSARVNPNVVSELLGHASVAITLDIYSHVLPDMQQDAALAMAALLTVDRKSNSRA
jgi:integrase